MSGNVYNVFESHCPIIYVPACRTGTNASTLIETVTNLLCRNHTMSIFSYTYLCIYIYMLFFIFVRSRVWRSRKQDMKSYPLPHRILVNGRRDSV